MVGVGCLWQLSPRHASQSLPALLLQLPQPAPQHTASLTISACLAASAATAISTASLTATSSLALESSTTACCASLGTALWLFRRQCRGLRECSPVWSGEPRGLGNVWSKEAWITLYTLAAPVRPGPPPVRSAPLSWHLPTDEPRSVRRPRDGCSVRKC